MSCRSIAHPRACRGLGLSSDNELFMIPTGTTDDRWCLCGCMYGMCFYILIGGVRFNDHYGEAAGEGFADGGGRGHAACFGGALGHRVAHL